MKINLAESPCKRCELNIKNQPKCYEYCEMLQCWKFLDTHMPTNRYTQTIIVLEDDELASIIDANKVVGYESFKEMQVQQQKLLARKILKKRVTLG